PSTSCDFLSSPLSLLLSSSSCFFHSLPPTVIYTLSLHDALPISSLRSPCRHAVPTRDSPPLFSPPNLSVKLRPRPASCPHRHQSPARKHGARKNGRRGAAFPPFHSLFSGCAGEYAGALLFDLSPSYCTVLPSLRLICSPA